MAMEGFPLAEMTLKLPKVVDNGANKAYKNILWLTKDDHSL